MFVSLRSHTDSSSFGCIFLYINSREGIRGRKGIKNWREYRRGEEIIKPLKDKERKIRKP